MKLLEGSEPIYVQLGDWLENEILSGRVKPEEKIYSQYKLSEIFGINPATALKGLNLLVEKDVVYKKRGLGMFVSPKALKILKKEHKNKVLTEQIRDIVEEATLLDVSEDELIDMLKKEMQRSIQDKTLDTLQRNRINKTNKTNETKKEEDHQ